MHQKLVPDPFLILENNSKQPLHAIHSFKVRYFERALSKILHSYPVPFINRRSYQKQKGTGTSNQSFFRLQNKLRKMYFLIIYYLTKFDDII